MKELSAGGSTFMVVSCGVDTIVVLAGIAGTPEFGLAVFTETGGLIEVGNESGFDCGIMACGGSLP